MDLLKRLQDTSSRRTSKKVNEQEEETRLFFMIFDQAGVQSVRYWKTAKNQEELDTFTNEWDENMERIQKEELELSWDEHAQLNTEDDLISLKAMIDKALTAQG